MTIAVKKSTQFKINELFIVTKTGETIDIQSIYEEISIFDSMFTPVMSGNILIKDAVGLSGILLFDGTEMLLMDISKDADSDIANFRKAFRIYKQSDRKNEGMNSETYVLHFAADEIMFSDQQRVNQSYEGTYSSVVGKILTNYLKVPENQLGGRYEDSIGIRKITIPNLRPLEAIDWCAKRAVDQNQSPNFMFFQNMTGFNFVTLSTLLSEVDVLDVRIEPKNQSKSNPISEMSSARAFEVVAQADSIERIRSGINAGQFIGFDPITKTTSKKQINFDSIYNSLKHANDNPNLSIELNRAGQDVRQSFDSKKTVNIFSAAQQLSGYIKEKDPTVLSVLDNMENYLFQRKAIVDLLLSKRIKVVMPGNFQLSSGFNVNVMAPTLGKKEKGSDNLDPSMNGKYLIVASRQLIKYDKHETIIEVASTSTNNDFIPAASPKQNQAYLSY
jgi:hypothetical protein